jgi:hypothetical protein
MVEEDELDARVREYVDICAAIFRSIRQQLGPPPRDRVGFWIPEPDSNFASGRVNWSVQEKEIVDWDSYSFPVHSAFKDHPGVNRLIEDIARLADIYVGRVRFVLSSLALRTGARAQRMPRKRLVSQVRAAVTREIEHDPGPSITRAFVLGGAVAGRRKLDGRTWLRPPRSADFPVVAFDRFNPGAALDTIRPHSILEARYGEGETPQGDEIRRWLTALRLATGLPILIPQSHQIPAGPTSFGMGATVTSPHVPTNYPPAEISKRTIGHARKIQRIIQDSPPPSFIEAAIDRLGRSIEEPSSVPQRLLYAVMGFEALLLTKDDRGPKNALANRIGVLLGVRPGAGQAMRDRIHRAYKLRSRYVHGHDLKPEEVQQLGKVYPELRGDLGRAIVASIVSYVPKAEFLRHLDDALVDPTLALHRRMDLRKRLGNVGLGGMLTSWRGET